MSDYVDGPLSAFVGMLVREYCRGNGNDNDNGDSDGVDKVVPAMTKCGYACSDHASAHKVGYASACVMESEFKDTDPRMHTGNDKLEFLSFEHMLEFAKVALSFAYEMGSVE